MDKKTEVNFLEISGIATLVLGIVFTIAGMLSDSTEQKNNNLIGALLCVSLSHMLSVIKDFNDRQ